MDFETHHKTVGNYRQIMNVKHLDVCSVMKHAENFPLFKPVFDFANETFPGLVHQCPYSVIHKTDATMSVNVYLEILFSFLRNLKSQMLLSVWAWTPKF
jgi:Protein of unknown function (DUF1091)